MLEIKTFTGYGEGYKAMDDATSEANSCVWELQNPEGKLVKVVHFSTSYYEEDEKVTFVISMVLDVTEKG